MTTWWFAEFLKAPGRAALALSSRAGEETAFLFVTFGDSKTTFFFWVFGGSVGWLVGWYGLVINFVDASSDHRK